MADGGIISRATRGPVFSSNARHFCQSYVLANKTDIKSAAYTQNLRTNICVSLSDKMLQ